MIQKLDLKTIPRPNGATNIFHTVAVPDRCASRERKHPEGKLPFESKRSNYDFKNHLIAPPLLQESQIFFSEELNDSLK